MSKFKAGDIVKVIDHVEYDGRTYHVRVIGYTEYRNDVFVGEVVYNEFNIDMYPGCKVGTVDNDFHEQFFELVGHVS